MSILNPEEKNVLRRVLTRPLVQKAIDLALIQTWEAVSGTATSIETSALAFKYIDGATQFVNRLNKLAELETPRKTIPGRRLKHEPPID